MKRRSKEKSIEVSAGQSGILFLLLNKSVKMSELGRNLGIDNSAITRQVDTLEGKGLVKREVNPSDRRQYIISLTEKGRQDVKILSKIANDTNKKIKDGFTESEIDIFIRVLTSFEEKF
jgi:DNA-binding MarR family transcriptional regulator